MKRIFISILLISIGVITGILLTNNVYRSYYSSNIINNTTTSNLVKSNSIAMMLETDIDSNEYYLSTDTSWPQTGYTFNESLSKCENGATLSWDSDNNQVLMTGSSSDKCYIYFDIISKIDEVCDTGDNLSNCIQELFSETGEGTVGIYYHDGTGDYTNAELEAGDYSYRYSGASDEVDNFVCFGDDCSDTDNLYRIIGAFKNDEGEYEVKLIKYDYCSSDMCGTDGDYYGTYDWSSSYVLKAEMTYEYDWHDYYLGYMNEIPTYYWNNVNYYTAYDEIGYRNVWSYSVLNTTNLNTNFINNISSTYSSMITTHTWIVGGNTVNNLYYSDALITYNSELIGYETSQVDTIYSDKIGLAYISDYRYAAGSVYWSYPGSDIDDGYDYRLAINSNWFYMGLFEWLITRLNMEPIYPLVAAIHYNGMANGAANVGSLGNYNNFFAIRPTFYLDTSVQYSSGSGTQSDPIILVTK